MHLQDNITPFPAGIVFLGSLWISVTVLKTNAIKVNAAILTLNANKYTYGTSLKQMPDGMLDIERFKNN